jgi:hypothetical protein
MQDLIRQLKQDTIVQYPREVEEALGELTPKQRRYVILVASGEPGYKAYRQAYEVSLDVGDDQVSVRSSNLKAIDKVNDAIKVANRWIETRAIASDNEEASRYCHQRWLELSRHDQPAVALRATELIARAAGMFVSRSEIRHIHALDTESTEAMLRNILGDLGIGDTIDAAFSAETQSNQQITTPSLGDSSCPVCGQSIG